MSPPPSSTSNENGTAPSSASNIKQQATIQNQLESTTAPDTSCRCYLYSETKELLIVPEHVTANVPAVQQQRHRTKKVNFVVGEPHYVFCGTSPMEEIGTKVKLSAEDGLQWNSGDSHHTAIIVDEGKNASHKVAPKRSNIAQFSSISPHRTSTGIKSRSTSPITVKPEIPSTSPATHTEKEPINVSTIPSPTGSEELTAAAIAAATSTAMYPSSIILDAYDVAMLSTSDSDSDSTVLDNDDEDYTWFEYDDDDSSGKYDSFGSNYSDDNNDDDDDSDVQDDDEEDTLVTIGLQAGDGIAMDLESLTSSKSKLKKVDDDDEVDDPSKDVIKILCDAPSIIDDVMAEFCCMFIPIDDCTCFPTN